VFQAHVAQVQTLQNELESLRAQFVNVKGKSSQLVNRAQHVQGSRSREGPLMSFYGLSHDAMVREYVFFDAHNYSLTLEFAIFFTFPILRHKKLVWHPKFLSLGK
jgi:hypothetical protein